MIGTREIGNTESTFLYLNIFSVRLITAKVRFYSSELNLDNDRSETRKHSKKYELPCYCDKLL